MAFAALSLLYKTMRSIMNSSLKCRQTILAEHKQLRCLWECWTKKGAAYFRCAKCGQREWWLCCFDVRMAFRASRSTTKCEAIQHATLPKQPNCLCWWKSVCHVEAIVNNVFALLQQRFFVQQRRCNSEANSTFRSTKHGAVGNVKTAFHLLARFVLEKLDIFLEKSSNCKRQSTQFIRKCSRMCSLLCEIFPSLLSLPILLKIYGSA